MDLSHNPRSRSFNDWSFWLYPLIACFVLLLLFSARQLTDLDMGFHLKTAEWMLQHHAVPRTDTYTYAAAGHEYVDSHWLYQLILYGIYKTFGYPALTLMNMTVLFGVFLCLLLRMRLTGAPPWLQCFLFLLTLLLTEPRFFVRPEIFSWFLLSVTLWILEMDRKDRARFLWLLPVIQLFWVNIEGLFVLGWIAMGAYVVSGWSHHKKIDLELSRWTALALMADLISPNFIKGILYPFSFISKLSGDNIYHQVVFELRSPWLFLTGQIPVQQLSLSLKIYFVIGLLTVFLFLWSFKKRKLHEFLLLIAFFYLSCTAVRNVSLYMIVIAPLIASSSMDFLTSFPSWTGPMTTLASKNKTLPIFLSLGLLLFGLRVFNDAFYISEGRTQRFGLGLDEDSIPVRSVDFLDQNHLDGKLLNHINLGGWVDWKAPQPAFIDGRLEVMGDDLFRDFYRSMRRNGLSSLLDQYQPQLVLFEYPLVYTWEEVLQNRPGWRLIYVDGSDAVYAAPDYASVVPTFSFPDLLTQRHLQPVNDVETEQLLKDLEPSPMLGWFQGFYQRQIEPRGLENLAVFSVINGQFDISQTFFVECLRETRGQSFDAYMGLGRLCFQQKKILLSKLCMEKALVLRPQNPAALQILDRINSGRF